MTTLQLDSQLTDIFGTLQIFDTPMFMVLVEPDGTMRFIGVNAAHQAGTRHSNRRDLRTHTACNPATARGRYSGCKLPAMHRCKRADLL